MFFFSRAGYRTAAWVIVIAAAYVIFAKIGFSLAFGVRQVTAVWPPSGLAVAALVLGGPGLWPGVALGAFVANLLTHEPPLCATGIAIGNTLGPLAAAYALRRIGFNPQLERVNDVLALTAFGLLSMIITATNGVTNLAVAGVIPWSSFGPVWRTWWTGDAMGILLFAPLLLTWIGGPRSWQRHEGGWLELLAFVPVGLGLASLGFLSNLRLGFLVYPVVIWSALRFGQRVTSAAIIAIAALAILGANNAIGPFSGVDPDERLVYLMTLTAVLSVTGLIFGAMTAERELAERRELEGVTRIAETLQAAFLPKRLPERSDTAFDALYLTAGHDALVGGDWYDAFTIPDGKIVISIGDMIGHGVGAAVTAAEIRQRILATAFNTSDPGEILARVNGTFGDEETIATALVAFIDPKAASMRFASAGHPPPIVAGRTILPRVLEYGSVPLGVLPGAEYETNAVQLERDAYILFYTDGVTELDHDVVAGERALIDAVGRLVHMPASANPTQVLQQQVMGSKNAIDDAVFMLVRLGAPARLSGDGRDHSTVAGARASH